MRAAILLFAALPAFGQIQEDVEALQSGVYLKSWQANYPREKFERAHYDTSSDKYQVDFARRDRWCGASVGIGTGGHIRAALFYLPENLTLNAEITNCKLGAIWQEAGDASKRDPVVSDLSQSWGNPNGTTQKPDIQGSAYWQGVAAWHRGDVDIWVALEQIQPFPTTKPPTIIYARRRMQRDSDLQSLWFNSVYQSQWAVAKYVEVPRTVPVSLTARMMGAAYCVERPLAESFSPADLKQWIEIGRSMPPPSRAGNLLLADFFLTCAQQSAAGPAVAKVAASLGARYETLFPQDGPQYSHNWRAEAEALAPHGVAGELAGLVTLTDPCYLNGKQPWLEATIQRATAMLRQFPEDTWTLYIHFVLGRAHATKLSFAQGGDPEGAPHPLSAAQMDQEWKAAIEQFSFVVKARPGSAEAKFAAQESWRLRAGLPPSQIHFGCSGE